MSSNHHSHTKNPQIFIAKLSPNIRERELEYEFRKFGRIRNLQLKRGYAFIEFDDYRDADDNGTKNNSSISTWKTFISN